MHAYACQGPMRGTGGSAQVWAFHDDGDSMMMGIQDGPLCACQLPRPARAPACAQGDCMAVRWLRAQPSSAGTYLPSSTCPPRRPCNGFACPAHACAAQGQERHTARTQAAWLHGGRQRKVRQRPAGRRPVRDTKRGVELSVSVAGWMDGWGPSGGAARAVWQGPRCSPMGACSVSSSSVGRRGGMSGAGVGVPFGRPVSAARTRAAGRVARAGRSRIVCTCTRAASPGPVAGALTVFA